MSTFVSSGGFSGGIDSQDDSRYRALGHSTAIPVMRRVGQRISAVDAILRDIGMQRLP